MPRPPSLGEARGIGIDLIESFVAEPGADGWADFVAVFRRQSARPFERRKRIADRTRALNMYDGALDEFPRLKAERSRTSDMITAPDLQANLLAAEADFTRLGYHRR